MSWSRTDFRRRWQEAASTKGRDMAPCSAVTTRPPHNPQAVVIDTYRRTV